MSDFVVTLVMQVDAEDSGDAARAFVDHLVDKGLRNWQYQVFDTETGSEGTYNGWGDRQGARPKPSKPTSDVDEPQSDEDLIRLAQDLIES